MALPQPLHIFRKDLLHLWPETLFVLILFVGFAAAAPSGWTGSQYAVYVAILAVLLKILMPISWLVLIARAVQDECLVGDRQFWTSRPYHWANLLAAKAILIFTCIYVPFFLMQVYLLKHVGLHPMLVIPALLNNLLLLTVVIIIPLAALSAVTSTFPRVLLSFIGAFLYVLILLGVVGWLTFLEMKPPHLSWLLDAIFIVLPAIALLIQYKDRKTLVARVLLGVTPLLAVLVLLLTPAAAWIRHAYPAASGSDVPTLSELPGNFMPKTAPEGKLDIVRGHVLLQIPVSVAGVDKRSNYLVQGAAATIDAPGVHWSSGFMTTEAELGSFRPIAAVNVPVPLEIFNKVAKAPADVHLSLATDHLSGGEPAQWKATLLPFSVPGNGICAYPADDPDANPVCRYPFKSPEFSVVTATLAAGDCASPKAPPVQSRMSLGSGATSLDFDPVVEVPLKFQTQDPNPDHHYLLCPGSNLNFIEVKDVGKTRLEVDEKQITLDPLAERIQTRSQAPHQSPNEPQ